MSFLNVKICVLIFVFIGTSAVSVVNAKDYKLSANHDVRTFTLGGFKLGMNCGEVKKIIASKKYSVLRTAKYKTFRHLATFGEKTKKTISCVELVEKNRQKYKFDFNIGIKGLSISSIEYKTGIRNRNSMSETVFRKLIKNKYGEPTVIRHSSGLTWYYYGDKKYFTKYPASIERGKPLMRAFHHGQFRSVTINLGHQNADRKAHRKISLARKTYKAKLSKKGAGINF